MVLKLICLFSIFSTIPSGCFGEVYQQYAYEFTQLCDDTVYGVLLETLQDVSNNLTCAMQCTQRILCMSFTYNDVNRTCILNTEAFTGTPPVSCSVYVACGTRENISTSTCLFNNPCTKAISNVRLCDGGGPGVCLENTGRVEVFYGGQWGTVCDDNWDDSNYYYYYYSYRAYNADIVCRMFGYTSGLSQPDGQAVSGSGTIWMDNVICDGTETHLFDCLFSGFGSNNCDHIEDVGVECV